MKLAVPPQPGENREIKRAAFALTEPLPFVGVDTGVVAGKLRVAEWNDGEEPMLQVEKRGRFITNMDFASFVTAAVDSGDERIKGSCMIILEETDPGVFDRGAPTLKMVHQLSSTRDPVFSLKVPASRIIGGYDIVDGVIVPKYNHSEIIGAVFHRTRIPVGLMSSAKLLSAVEPVIRYHRGRFRGGEAQPGAPRFDLGLQMKEDALQRLIDVWATGEAGCSLGFAAARLADEYDPLEKEKDAILAEQGVTGARAQMTALRKVSKQAIEFLAKPADQRDAASLDALARFVIMDAEINVLIPACKLWCTGYGATMMREAVALMGGYGITEDCPGFLGHKWFDCQLEATYEGPEAVQRRHLSLTMANDVFLALVAQWAEGLAALEETRPGLGGRTLSLAMKMWLWTLDFLQKGKDPLGKRLFHGQRQGVSFPLADALCWLVSCRCFIDDTLELLDKGPMNPVVAEGMEGLASFYVDMCRAQSARAAGEVARVCVELAYGYVDLAPEGAAEFARWRRSWARARGCARRSGRATGRPCWRARRRSSPGSGPSWTPPWPARVWPRTGLARPSPWS